MMSVPGANVLAASCCCRIVSNWRMRTASATDTTCHWTGVIVVAVAAPVTWKVVIDWITSAEGIAMHAEAASTCCRDQQGALRPMKWPRIYSASADKGKSDDKEKEPVHFSMR